GVAAGPPGSSGRLQEISACVRDGSLRPGPAGGAAPAVPDAASPASFSAAGVATAGRRWCTECLVSGPAIDRRRLREALAGLGDSLVIAGGRRRARVHVHVDDPEAVFRIAAGFGAVAGRKADDMFSQQASARGGARTVAIVTDSAADLPEDVLAALDIHVVPARIHFGDHSYLDKVSLDTAEFYRMMATSAVHPTTSQPPPGDFRRLYQILGSHHPGIISIHL